MASVKSLTFVVAVNSRRLFEDNFLASPCLRNPSTHQVLIQEGYSSASLAYNQAIDESGNDLIIFCHQDVYFPEPWLSQLQSSLDFLETHDPDWGVLGCGGITRDGRVHGHLYSTGSGLIGRAGPPPSAPVQTLDEVVLIIRRSSGLRFDETLPHFHFYGTDICCRAASRGMKSYAISAFCIHNTQRRLVLPKEFYECYKHVKWCWKDSLPIRTTCTRITRLNIPIYLRRLRELYRRYTGARELGETRAQNVRRLLEGLNGVDRADLGNVTVYEDDEASTTDPS